MLRTRIDSNVIFCETADRIYIINLSFLSDYIF